MSGNSVSAAVEHSHGGARTYGKVLGALLLLTGITVFVAGFDFGALNVVVALAVATAKATLVAMFFMHLKDDKPMNSIIFLGGVVALAFFLGLSLIDSGTRTVVRPTAGARAETRAAAVP